MYSRRNFLLVSAGALATASLAVSSCAFSASVTETSSTTSTATTLSAGTMPPRDMLRVAISGTPKHFDPALYSVVEEYQLGFALFDGLVQVDEALTAQPMLAEAWEASRDLLQWTFRLREDVLFHHGTPLTAVDVVYTFTRILDPRVGSNFRNTLSFIEMVEAIDDYTVRFVLKSPSAELPILLGAPQARIVAHDYDSETLDKKPSGSGPFLFVKDLPGDRVQLTRNPNYWLPDQPRLEAVELIFMPYAQQISALQRDLVDVMLQVGMADVATLMEDTAIAVQNVAGGAYQSLVLRATTKPFQDVRVREALKYCVDRPALIREQLQNRGQVGNDHPVAPISAFHANLPYRAYDPDHARSLLVAAGYRQGLKLDLITSTVRPGMIELALAFKEMAAPAGVDVDVIRTPPQVYWSDYAGRVPFHTGNWGFRPSIDETFMVAYHSLSKGNESHWRSPVLDDLIDRARGEADKAERQDLYHQAQQLIMNEGAVIIPYFLPTTIATRSNIQGLLPHPSGWLDFRQTSFL